MSARSIVSILHTLTSEEYVRSENSDSNEMEALIAEYFTGNDELTRIMMKQKVKRKH